MQQTLWSCHDKALERTRVEVCIKRSSLTWLNEQAKREGKSRSALVRDLLVEAIAARQSR